MGPEHNWFNDGTPCCRKPCLLSVVQSHLGKLKESYIPAAEDGSILCWRLALHQKAAVISLPGSQSMGLDGCPISCLPCWHSCPFAGWVTPAKCSARSSQCRNVPALSFTGGPTPTPRAGKPCPQPLDSCSVLSPLALQPSPIGCRGTVARAGKQKGKQSWGSQGSPSRVLSSCGQPLEWVRAS